MKKFLLSVYVLLTLFALLPGFVSCSDSESGSDYDNSRNFDSKTGLYSEPSLPDADKACILYYRAAPGTVFYGFDGDLYAHIGVVEGEWKYIRAEWNENTEKCKWHRESENLWSLKLIPNIREWFGSGTTLVVKIGVVVRNADGTKQTEDLFVKVRDEKYNFVPAEIQKIPVPEGMEHGINVESDSSVTFVMYDRDKNGNSHDYCCLIGDFSDWECRDEYVMKRDDDAGCWWYVIDNTEDIKSYEGSEGTGRQYLFQYYVGNKDGDAVRLTDPYSEMILDPWNDKYISSSTYPGMISYPRKEDGENATSGQISVFEIGGNDYDWESDDFRIVDENNLVIYEMLLRDFSETGDLNGAMKKLDYIDALGVNAIELLPVQEFDGNDSWGYNPNHYFALDKAYGTPEMYKKFIDECHKRKIAVILDVVYNHATELSPMAKLYCGGDSVSEENPWFNAEAPHPYSYFIDWNHESALTRDYVKRNLVYLLNEYRVDGFRFDLSKGFTQRKSTESTVSNYDASRIAILKDYNAVVKAENPDALVILEHFCCDKEEKELAREGMKLWRNLNNAYCQTAMGYRDNSSFTGLWTGSNGMKFGSYVGYMESHDEERTAFKAKKYGIKSVKKSLEYRMRREALNAAFFFLVPGPKMFWQFGELGYDISVDYGGRTGRKPLKWDYLNNADRRRLCDTYASLIKFRRDNVDLFTKDARFSWMADSSDWDCGRFIYVSRGDRGFVTVGNFTDEKKTLKVDFSRSGCGIWKNYFDEDEKYDSSEVFVTVPAGDFKLFVNF